MRVLHVVTVIDDGGSSGGALAGAVNQCVELRRRGHDARIAGGWGGRGPAPRAVEGVPVHLFRVVPVLPGLGTAGLFSPVLLHWVRREATSFDAVHLHLGRALVPLLVAARLRRSGVPYVAQPHGALNAGPGAASPLVRAVDRHLTRPALLAARHVFAASPEERDAVARVSGTARDVSLLRGGVVPPERVPVTPASGPADVLFLGRLQPDRRVLAFAAAADRLVADGIDATFTVIGPDGGDLRALRRFIAERPYLAGRLRYDGALPHGRAVARLRRADLYVLPSVDTQAYPVSLLEAMAAGVPSICTTECSIAGVLAREHAAIVANPTDDALFGAMRRVLTDRNARARLSVRAAATAASEFSMAPVAEVLEEEYGAAAGGRAPEDAGTRSGPPGDDRQRVLWVLPAATQAHVEVWDALRSVARLTVALVGADGAGPHDADPTGGDPAGGDPTGADPTGADPTSVWPAGDPWSHGEHAGVGAGTRAGVEEAALAGRGYPVLRLPVGRGRAPRGLRTLLADRPHAVVLEGLPRRARATAGRWARQAGVPVVTGSDAAGRGAAVRAALAGRGGGPAAGERRIELDLRATDPAATVPGWLPGTAPGTAPGGGRDDDVIDLQQRSRSSGRHRA